MSVWKVEVVNALGQTRHLEIEANSRNEARNIAEREGYQVVAATRTSN